MTAVRQCCCNLSKEFKEFTLRGNIFDLAIGIIIGNAFQNVVKSLVDDILTPPFGFIFDGVDFSNLTIKLINILHKNQPPVVIRYGLFLQQILHLLIMAIALFFLMKFLNRLQRITQNNSPNISQDDQQDNHQQDNNSIQISEELKVLCDIRDLIAKNQMNSSSQSTSNLIHL